MSAPLRVAVVGAGPVGLDAALACRDNGWDVTVYEAADHVGGHVRVWGHVRMFTPWDLKRLPTQVGAPGGRKVERGRRVHPVPVSRGPPAGRADGPPPHPCVPAETRRLLL